MDVKSKIGTNSKTILSFLENLSEKKCIQPNIEALKVKSHFLLHDEQTKFYKMENWVWENGE